MSSIVRADHTTGGGITLSRCSGALPPAVVTLQVWRMTYGEFWPHYLRAHRRGGTRALHYAGSLLAVALLAAAAVRADWRLVPVALVVGYGLAWIGHFAVEGNRPATFGHPAWSLVSDYRMVLLWLTGRLGPHLARAGSIGGGDAQR
jgi:hypothetical protein